MEASPKLVILPDLLESAFRPIPILTSKLMWKETFIHVREECPLHAIGVIWRRTEFQGVCKIKYAMLLAAIVMPAGEWVKEPS